MKYLIINPFLIISMLLLTTACSKHPNNLEVGKASWYGNKHHGKQTASGERFDMYALTAAHKTFPFNTKVKVTNLKNNRSIVVRINDRGPFVRGRIIDLSYAAAKKLGMIQSGVVKVKLQRLK